MRENGLVNIEMDSVFKFGQMELNMKEIGKKIGHMEKVSFGTSVETFMMEIGKKIEFVVKENIFMLMELNMRDIGMMINHKDMALKYG